jgi:hypothetical protein
VRPESAAAGPTIQLAGGSVATLTVPHDALATPFGITFEEASERLSQLPRLFIEPDGSFFWGSAAGELPAWQLDGNLFDRNGRLVFVDLRGSCPTKEFDRLLGVFGWPQTPLVFQLVREALPLDEADFRRWAAREATEITEDTEKN